MSEDVQPLEVRRVPLGRRLLWGGAAGVLLGLAAFGLRSVPDLTVLEMFTLDLRQRLLARPTPTLDQLAVVLIDDYSIAEVRKKEGVPWPWPRDFYEPIILFLKDAGARAIVFDILFADPSPRRDADEALGAAAGAARIVSFAAKLGITPREVEPEPPSAHAALLEKATVQVEGWRFPGRESINSLVPPIPEVVKGASGIGFVNVVPDFGGTLRRMDLLYPYPDGDRCMASIAFDAVRSVLGRDLKARVEGNTLRFGDRSIPIDRDGRLLVRFYGKEGTITSYNAVSLLRSFMALQEGKPVSVDPGEFRDRIVFIGANAAAVEDASTTPVSEHFPGTELVATVCANILGGDSLREMSGAERLTLYLGMGAAAGLLSYGLWKLLPAALAILLVFAGHVAAACLGYRADVVIDTFFVMVLLAGMLLLSAITAYFLEGRQKREVARAFGQYLSPVVIRDLFKHPEALKLGGEKREIAIYFSDIAGFSSFSETMESERLVKFLNIYLTAMSDVILDRGGVVDKYIGDAIMAFWGAPLAIESPARQACLAVVEQRRALPGLNARFQAEGFPPIRFRAGLHLGSATVGNMGSSRRFDYTAMGDTVNLASRLEGANKLFGTDVLLSGAVRAAAGNAVVARRLGRVQVVGKAVPTEVHELLGTPADLLDEDLRRLERYHEALALLERGEARRAAEAFAALRDARSDPVIELCLKKCREVEATRAPWDGVWVLTSKG